MEEAGNSASKEINEIVEEEIKVSAPAAAVEPSRGGGWGGWGGFSPFSVLSDLQKAATVAAEEISRNVTLPYPYLEMPNHYFMIFWCIHFLRKLGFLGI